MAIFVYLQLSELSELAGESIDQGETRLRFECRDDFAIVTPTASAPCRCVTQKHGLTAANQRFEQSLRGKKSHILPIGTKERCVGSFGAGQFTSLFSIERTSQQSRGAIGA